MNKNTRSLICWDFSSKANFTLKYNKIYKYVDVQNFMTYTEIKKRNNNQYYYRVISVRKGLKVTKLRDYLGVNLKKSELKKKEIIADLSLQEKADFERLIFQIQNILKQNNVKKAGIFGSFVKRENKKTSDIDIIIEPPKNIGFGFIKIKEQLERKLKKDVDLITYDSLSPFLREEIMNSEVRII
jgi:uncharacterized protein